MLKFLAAFSLLLVLALQNGSVLYRSTQANVRFVSDAPMERIEASTSAVTGVLDLTDRSFAVQIQVREFMGFNSPLQREHFNENYVRSDRFPTALFKGRIIESVDLGLPSTHSLRAKGEMTIGGVVKERTVECELRIEKDGIRVRSVFEVPLDDHGIRIPRVVQQKIAPNVQVHAELFFEPAPAPRK
ncbi:MAG: YceI family protein [Flavobacteriales bacterium]|nr:YceI family protein [Flavobacteriales bacterium]